MDGRVISEIKVTKKGRYAFFCDGEFLFSVDEEAILEYSLHTGKQLQDETIRELREKADLSKAKNKAYDLLSRRAHSRYELYQKLEQRYDAPTAKAAVDEAERLSYIDDGAYAKECVESLFSRKGMSRLAAERYLSERGIDKDLIEEVLFEYSDGDEERIRELVSKKYLEKLKRPEGYRTVFAALARRGFSNTDIRTALEEYKDNEWAGEE